MTVQFLKRLFTDLRIPWTTGEKPKSEIGLLKALMDHIMGDRCTDEFASLALQRRSGVDLEPIPSATQAETALLRDEGAALEFDDENDEETIDARRAYEDLKRYLANKRTELEKQKSNMAALRLASTAPSSSASRSGHPVAPSERRTVAPLEDGWTREQAMELLPPGASIYKDPVDHRWRCKAPYMASSKSKAWGEYTALRDYEAMVFVLECAWVAFQKAGGHPRPWRLHDEPA